MGLTRSKLSEIYTFLDTNNDLQNITQKTEDWAAQTTLKTGGELRCSGRVSSSCSTCDTHRTWNISKWCEYYPYITMTTNWQLYGTCYHDNKLTILWDSLPWQQSKEYTCISRVYYCIFLVPRTFLRVVAASSFVEYWAFSTLHTDMVGSNIRL
jgi:hypothetical protein